MKRTSVIGLSKDAIQKHGADILRFSDLEGLEAHGLSAAEKKKKKRKG